MANSSEHPTDPDDIDFEKRYNLNFRLVENSCLDVLGNISNLFTISSQPSKKTDKSKASIKEDSVLPPHSASKIEEHDVSRLSHTVMDKEVQCRFS